MLIDTHAHLNDNRLLPHAEQIAKDMASDNLHAIINVGFDEKSSKIALDLCKYERFFAAVGVHPHDAKQCTAQTYEHLKSWASNQRVVAIGEFGLDYYYDHSPREVQKQSMIQHLMLANELKLPIILHCRDAYGDLLDILKSHKNDLNSSGVVHCYSGSIQSAKQFLDLGLYLSFGGVLTFKNAKTSVEAASFAPRDKVIVETDCPYLTPVPHRGELNFPKYVNFVAQRLSEIWQKTLEETQRITTQNAQKLFERMS